MKKRILLVSDVKGWGGYVRGQYIKKYLKDDYDIHIMDAIEFNQWELRINSGCFTDQDLKDFARKGGKQKNFYSFDDFQKFIKGREKNPWDLYYFLFHTMLMKKSVKRLVRNGNAVMTIVTGFPTLKNIFYGASGRNHATAKNRFLGIANKCKAVCANNYKSLEDLKSIYKGPSYYLPRGVDPEIFYPMTTFERKPESKFTVAYVGKPVPEKGLQNFIRPACQEANVNLIINDRNYQNALSPEEMNVFYNQADVYLVSSTIDGTPNPALEAASCGKPIIANEIGNMPEFIKEGVNGFMVERDVRKYANKLRWMKQNQGQAFEMGQEARKEILRNWTWEKVINTNEREAFRRILC